ncbi:hypothetical protein D5086_025558 [Populus alba]|uniref:Uncharacterized protein n=1 Tax=Populus alba TaxID=43335 RepID=A0ACC4AZY3_POPAL
MSESRFSSFQTSSTNSRSKLLQNLIKGLGICSIFDLLDAFDGPHSLLAKNSNDRDGYVRSKPPRIIEKHRITIKGTSLETVTDYSLQFIRILPGECSSYRFLNC